MNVPLAPHFPSAFPPTARILLTLTAADVSTAGCGEPDTALDTTGPADDADAPGGDQPVLGAGPYPIADLSFVVRLDGSDGDRIEYRLACIGDTATLTGVNLNPNWPSPALAFEQRLGAESESYTCIFAASGQTIHYDTEDLNIFLSCQIGASFTLSINTLGAVVSIEP